MRVGQKSTKSNGKAAPTKWKPKHAKDPGVEAVERIGINLLALPGGGKTGAALTISKKFPKSLPAKKPVVLDDVIHVGWDQTALVGFRHLGLRVPYHFDVLEMMTKNEWGVIDTMRAIKDEAYEICEKVGGISGYIDDTMTAWDWMMVGELSASGWEGVQVYLQLKTLLQEYRMDVFAFPGQPILVSCFHLAAPAVDIVDKRDPKAKDKKKAADYVIQGEGGFALTPAVSRSLKTFFFGAGSMELLCRSYKTPQGAWKYEIKTEDFKDVRTKNRFRGLLNDTEPANLQVILDKVRKG